MDGRQLVGGHAHGARGDGRDLVSVDGHGGALGPRILEGELDLAQGDAVPVPQRGGLDAVSVDQDSVAALEVLDLVAAAHLPDHAVVAADARVGKAQRVVQLAPHVDFLVHDLELSDARAFVHQQLGHRNPRGWWDGRKCSAPAGKAGARTGISVLS